VSPIGFVAFNGLLLAAAASDLRTMRIPNLLPMMLAIGALLLDPPGAWSEALSRLTVAALIGVIGLVLWMRHVLGGGDLKLLAAAGLWIPLDGAATFATYLGLAGGIQSLAFLAWVKLQPTVQPHAAPGWRYMPYAVAIAGAGLAWSCTRLG